MDDPKPGKRHWFRFSLRTLFVLVAVIGIILTVRDWLNPTNDRPFNRQAWLANEGDRYRMLDDLMRHHLRIGMSRDDVRRLLGPETTYAFGSEYRVGDWQNDADFLIVRYDSLGRLIHFRTDGF